MGYLRPADVPISDSWQGHKNRNPPSSEPGTDYATAYGSQIRCADNGWVTDLKTSNSAATGRYVTVILDDFRTVRYLHLSTVDVGIGWRVGRGQIIAHSGASAHGSDWGVGAHVHTTLWPGTIWADPTIDFEAYVGDDTPPPPDPEEDEMNIVMYLYQPTNSLLLVDHQNKTIRELGSVSNDLREYYAHKPYVTVSDAGNPQGLPSWASLTDGYVYITHPNVEPTAPTSTSHPLATPAWVGGVLLGLIGLVEVLRFVFDYLT